MKSFKHIIQNGGVAVIRTDTLYGLVADAFNEIAVERIYQLKKRNKLKPVIVLVADYSQIKSFGVSLNSAMEKELDEYWPGKVSIILPVNNTIDMHYIHKGTHGIAFRIPADESLLKTLKDVGPLVAPSANREGDPPAQTIAEAMDYFGDSVDYYVDGGQVTNTDASKIIKISNTVGVEVIRDK